MLSAKDLCAIEFLDKLIEAGIHSFKIEGRKRSPEYVSTVVSVYRKAIDLYFENKLTEEKKKEFLEKLKTAYHRGLSTGFYFGIPSGEDFSKVAGSAGTTKKEYIGKIKNFYKQNFVIFFALEYESLKIGDQIMIQGPTTGVLEEKIENMMVNDKLATAAKKSDFISIKISKAARKNDKLFLIRSK